MNAPKEYYPVGYEKNFDDNFQTRVDLPPTSFHCGDQKHFPGLYGDVDLGCMVCTAKIITNRLHSIRIAIAIMINDSKKKAIDDIKLS